MLDANWVDLGALEVADALEGDWEAVSELHILGHRLGDGGALLVDERGLVVAPLDGLLEGLHPRRLVYLVQRVVDAVEEVGLEGLEGGMVAE